METIKIVYSVAIANLELSLAQLSTSLFSIFSYTENKSAGNAEKIRKANYVNLNSLRQLTI